MVAPASITQWKLSNFPNQKTESMPSNKKAEPYILTRRIHFDNFKLHALRRCTRKRGMSPELCQPFASAQFGRQNRII